MRRMMMAALAAVAVLTGCQGSELDTRTFELRYMSAAQAQQLVGPYVYADREGAPGHMSASAGAITVRETPDNLAKIERMLEEFDRPQPLVMLHFQVIRANGSAEPDPAIADVERELRRLFRFDGYELVAESRAGVMEGASLRQVARGEDQHYGIHGGVLDIRGQGGNPTIALELQLSADQEIALETGVTIPVGHAVVVGTAQTRTGDALILVVRAEIAGGAAPPADSTPAESSNRG